MRISNKQRFITALICFVWLCTAKAQLIDFDFSPLNAEAIPQGYAGLNWTNFSYTDYALYPPLAGSGYQAGAISGRSTALNARGEPAAFFSASEFDVTSLWLTAAWNDGLSVKIDGLSHGDLLYSTTVVVNTTQPLFVSLNFDDVDRVEFSAFGGIHRADLIGFGTHFAMDDLRLNGLAAGAVPEPATYGLVGSALLLGVGLWRRRRKST
ncbi:MAG: PEP-CTERM sorting domain-containing protein [Nibricoccus sp.]